MKILMTTSSFPLYKGDTAGIFVYEQAKFLVQKGLNLEILAPMGDLASKFEVMDDIKVRRFNYFYPLRYQGLCYGAGVPDNMKKGFKYKIQLPFLLLFFFLNILIRGSEKDIIYAHWTLSGLAAVIAGKILKKPVIVMIHHGQNQFKLGLLIRYVIENADYIVFNSSYTEKQVRRYFNPRSFSVIPPGVDTLKFRPFDIRKYSSFLRGYGIKEGLPVIFAMGRHIQWKGYEFLIQAVKKLEFDFLLVLAGSGPETENLKHLSSELGLEDKVIFTGSIKNYMTPIFYNRTSVFVQPSIIDDSGNTEGLGVVIMEAMACGIPCIGSKVGGIPDLIVDGVNGSMVEAESPELIADRIKFLLESDSKSFSLNSRQYILKNFCWNKLVCKNIHLMEKIIKGY